MCVLKFPFGNQKRSQGDLRAFYFLVSLDVEINPQFYWGEDKKSSATIKSGEASAKPQRNNGKN